MAEKRMFSKSFVDSDTFSDLSNEAKLLYFYLGIHADDDGFIGQARRIAKGEGIEENCIRELLDKGFLFDFEDSKVYLLRHWNVNNNLQSDRYKGTQYQTEFATVMVNKNKVYERKQAENKLDTDCNQGATNEYPQDSVVKVKGTQNSSLRIAQKNVTQKRAGEAGGNGYTHYQLMTFLMKMNMDEGAANKLISDLGGDEVTSTKLQAWIDNGQTGKFEQYARGFHDAC